MPGRNSSDNKLGASPFIVGPILGDGCTYSTVQSAIDDCFAAGGGTVFIKSGTYVENLTFRAGVDLYGYQVDGRLPPVLSKIVIQGNHTYTVAGGFGAVLCNQISFSALAGDILTVNATGGAQAIFAAKYSGFDATTNPASRVCVLNADGVSAAQFSTDNTNISSSSHCFETTGAGSHAAFISLGSCNSSSGDVFRHSSGSASFNLEFADASSSAYVFNGVVTNANVTFSHADVSSGNEAVFFLVGVGQCTASHSTISSAAASGVWIDGLSGQVNYVDVALTGSAQGIGAAITQLIIDWQPYAQSGASASPVTIAPRGTASFDSAQFTVTDGFVQANSSGIFPWVDQPGLNTVVSNQGNFNTSAGANLLTLPVAPVQGDVCKFKCTNANALTVTCTAPQTIQFANTTSIPGGNITSTAIGDAVELTYFAAGNVFMANAIIGNWIVI